ncbi:hypothetical protein P691DRAFT_810494 [Macrolepiota fuliginosa MF-IS2]|uniref:Uncharacterized protein n=1 Tax=Macrolepiota fuliginosa MF-IS2 TaxID=1400762 RepID=A0A9P5X353_9AGAR|nr:hypothetical protein P691DRAFT_810494 [Macrolepiota fuliginosa MF-IS2]
MPEDLRNVYCPNIWALSLAHLHHTGTDDEPSEEIKAVELNLGLWLHLFCDFIRDKEGFTETLVLA